MTSNAVKISENIEIHDLALFLKKEKVLIISDLHLGYEEMLHSSGVLIPNLQYKDIKARLKPILESTKPKQIIINGDLKHEFGRISQQEWDEVKGLLTFLKEYTSKITLVKGNHDTILGPIARFKEVNLVKSAKIGNVLITHGDKLPRATSDKLQAIIIGHEHPAIGITDGEVTEVYKCFLKGLSSQGLSGQKQGSKLKTHAPKPITLIVQPSFCLITEGTNILKERPLSPFLKDQNMGKFEVWAVAEGMVMKFGEVGKLIKSWNR